MTYVPYDPSLETPDEGTTNGRLTGIQSVRKSSPSRVELAAFNPMQFLLEPELGPSPLQCWRPCCLFRGSCHPASERLPDAMTTGRIQWPALIDKVVAQQRSRGHR